MKTLTLFILSIAMVPISQLSAASVATGDIPDGKAAIKLPSLVSEKNEAAIARSFVNTDPKLVLGCVIDTQTGEVYSLEGYLTTNANPVIETKTELLFKDLVENSLAANLSYLGFVSGELSSSNRAEITLVKNSVVKARQEDLRINDLRNLVAKLSSEERSRYGLIIAYTDFIVTANFFRSAGAKAEAQGFGAKLGGSWFNRTDKFRVDRTVVATYTPLKLLSPAFGMVTNAPLSDALKTSIRKESLKNFTQPLKTIDKSIKQVFK